MWWIIPVWIFSLIVVAAIFGALRLGKEYDEMFAEALIKQQREELDRKDEVIANYRKKIYCTKMLIESNVNNHNKKLSNKKLIEMIEDELKR